MEELVIEAGRARANYLRDLWRFRDLLAFLAWRDLLVRYKQTAIGVAWALIRPLLTILVGAGIFGGLARLPSDGVPYAVMVCAGMLPWYFFSSAMSESANSLVGSASLITKIYFPRLILPLSTMLVALVDFAISLVILAGLMAWHGMMPTWRLLLLPAFILLGLVSAMGPGLLFTAMNVKYRDFRYIVPFVVQFGLYVTPVFYSSSLVQERLGYWGRMLNALNPVVGVIDGFRWAICGTVPLHWQSFALSSVLGILLLAAGVGCFRRVERTIADVI